MAEGIMEERIIAGRVRDIRRRVALAAGGAGDAAALIAAGKGRPASMIRRALCAGADAAGENRVQELLEKDAQGAYGDVPPHFIGRLQKNKVSKLVGRAGLIHSVDSLSLAGVIDVCAGKAGVVQPVLAQVNIALEETKGGFPPDGVIGALEAMASLECVQVLGLMCIPPPGGAYFEQMRRLYDAVRARNIGRVRMEILSMGMSGDFEEAVRAGANMVRVGAALFGD